MKLSRLNSPSCMAGHETATDAHGATQPAILPVAAPTTVQADRRRSRQEEMAEIEALATGPFHGQDQIRQAAHAVAESLAQLGPGAARLVRSGRAWQRWHAIDDEA